MSGDLQGSPLVLPALLYSPSSTPRRSGVPPPRFPASPSANTGRTLVVHAGQGLRGRVA